MRMAKFAAMSALWVLYGAVVSHSAGHEKTKRSDDTNPLTVVVNQLSQDMATLQAQVQALQNRAGKVSALHAALSTSTPTPNAPIHLNVMHQTGSGYDATSGMYIAPYSGWYAVDFQLFPKQTTQGYFNVDLILNDARAARARCIDPALDTTCNSGVTLHVNAGDKLYFRTDLASVEFYTNGFDSFVSIALLSADNA